MRSIRPQVLFSFLVLASAALTAQEPAVRGPRAVYVTTPTELRAWDTTIDTMVRARQLVVIDSRADPDIDGRRHETLAQYFQGIPVFGGSLSRQTARGATVSIIGTLFEGVSTDSAQALGLDAIVRALEDVSAGRLAAGPPRLVIFPTISGGARLAYQATMTDRKTYVIDATTGGVLWSADEMKTQSQVGVGTGALGDSKKMSTTLVAGTFRAHDQLRPAPIRTFDTRGSEAALNRLINPPGAATDADFSVDSDNTWTDPPAVDTHVHAGWIHDYLFKQLNWTGIDNRRGTITTAVHSGLINNAFFIGPPFGPEGRGMFVFGRTPGGAPVTTLDIVGHEMMHGVTNAALVQRTGNGLLDVLFLDRLGPTSMRSGGSLFPCDTTLAVFTDGRRLPLLCQGGRYVLLSNHPGAINEAFSDVVGAAAEFFHQPTGTGPLRADYKMGEDVAGFGPIRALDAPASLVAVTSSAGSIPYPDHASRAFTYLAAISQGTPAAPQAVLVLPWTLSGEDLVTMSSADDGGVHVNSTVLTHAFYLAVEGGRNATSGLTVQGVGAANRVQIERAFFRAMTLLMPNTPRLLTAAQAVVQAAIDLFGPSSAAADAVRQAMQAVGLM